ERGRERVPAGDGFLVVVGDRRALVDLAEAVDGARVEEQRRGKLGLARAAVSHERHVANAGRVEDLHGEPPMRESYDRAWRSAIRIGGLRWGRGGRRGWPASCRRTRRRRPR